MDKGATQVKLHKTALKALGETLTNPGLIPQQIGLSKFVDVF